MQFESLDNIIKDILLPLGDTELEEYSNTARLVSRIVSDLDLSAFPNIESDLFEVPDNLVVTLPSFVEEITKVATPHANGELSILGRLEDFYNVEELKEKNLNEGCTCVGTKQELVDKLPEAASTSEEYGALTCFACTFHNYIGAGSTAPAYGYRPKMWKNGKYKYDQYKNRLIFNGGYDVKPGSLVVVEYKRMGNDVVKYVPKRAFNAIRHKVLQYRFEAMGNEGAANSQERKFKDALDQMIEQFSDYSLEDFLASFRSGYYSGIKA